MNFFGGSFFGGGFFGAVAPGATAQTPAGGVISGRKRRWVQIGDRLYHASEAETRLLLANHIGQKVEIPDVPSKPPKKKRSQPRKIAVEVPEVIKAEFRDDYVRYKRMYDDYMAQLLLEAFEDEDDIEVLLLH